MNSKGAYFNTISHNKQNSGVSKGLWDSPDVLTKSTYNNTSSSLTLNDHHACYVAEDTSAQSELKSPASSLLTPDASHSTQVLLTPDRAGSTLTINSTNSTTSIDSLNSTAPLAALYVSGPCQFVAVDKSNRDDLKLSADRPNTEGFLLHHRVGDIEAQNSVHSSFIQLRSASGAGAVASHQPLVQALGKTNEHSYLQNTLSQTNFSSPYEQQAFITLIQELGRSIQQAFMDDDVTEIMLNTDGRVFIEYNSRGMVEAGYLDVCSAQAVIRTLASLQDRELDSNAPILSTDIPNLKARFEGVLPPLTNAPIFSIRKHNTALYSLDRLCRLKMLSASQKSLLQDALQQHFSMVVSGPTGSGKTALINSLLGELATVFPDERIITIEDTPELFISSANHLNLYTSSKVDMSCLVRSSLRLRPDRLIVGEVRGPEALDLIDAFLTGHSGGFTSVHGGSVKQALNRLMLLISRHRSAPRNIGPVVADAIDMVIQVQKEPYRHVSEIALVKGFVRESFAFRVLDPEQSSLSQDDFER